MLENFIMVNGKQYPMWSQIINQKKEWIGGTLVDKLDTFNRQVLKLKEMRTEIMDIELLPNGQESAFFQIVGKDFNCGGDVSCTGIYGEQDKDGLTFSGYGNHLFKIMKPLN